ncbi:MAG: hypothetical protein GY777_29090 [Candidatus Brocadiaceae bacterium]|nr:hypothetical protein [Candidatus Brocadiaceae bacterium]
MKVVAFSEHGGVDKFKYTDIEEPVVDSIFPLADAVAVQAKKLDRRQFGKIVLVPEF